mmetsp:Transcript_16343/g.31936  ORF Transcript_16343/g.31936 Transcript_16343/m.31936 type:complete len:166 (+) Transcript_16343:55-552(+)
MQQCCCEYLIISDDMHHTSARARISKAHSKHTDDEFASRIGGRRHQTFVFSDDFLLNADPMKLSIRKQIAAQTATPIEPSRIHPDTGITNETVRKVSNGTNENIVVPPYHSLRPTIAIAVGNNGSSLAHTQPNLAEETLASSVDWLFSNFAILLWVFEYFTNWST